MENSGPARSKDFWFQDGSIVLQADRTLFRVHKSILAQHSVFFRDMDDISRSTSDQAVIDGAPLVIVHDAKEDWENVLGAVYNSLESQKIMDKLSPFRALSLVQTSKKYQFDKIQTAAVSALESIFPQTLDKYNDRYSLHIIRVQAGKFPGKCDCLACDIAELIRCINGALQWDVQTILPTAYMIATLSISPKDLVFGRNDKHDTPAILSRPAQFEILTGIQCMDRMSITIFHTWIANKSMERPIPCKVCKTVDKCFQVFEARQTELLDLLARMKNVLQASFFLRPVDFLQLWTHEGFCVTCQNVIKERHLAMRQLLWEQVPVIFGLTSWEAVKSSQCE